MCDQLYTHWDLYNWSFVWRISPLLRIVAWTNFKWSLCDVSGGYQYIKSPDVFMQMKRSSNDFLSIHIPSYLSPSLCVVFHFLSFFFCAVLLSAALFLFILHILLSCQAWEDRICDKSKRIGGLDSTTYIKASKHPRPVIRTYTLPPRGLVYVSILLNRLKRIPISGPLRRYFPQQVFLYLFILSSVWLCFIHLIFTLW